MRKLSKILIFVLLFSSLFLNFFTVPAQSAKIPTFKIGVTQNLLGSWDGPIASIGIAADYSSECVEPLMMWPVNWSGDYDDVVPVLATNWTIIPWPDDMNHHPTDPFMNTGGVKAIDITLRENVTFHDGSAFNATVAKWNIDRGVVITGNLTGKLDPNLMSDSMYKAMWSFWLPADKWSQYETDSWNVSQFIGQPASYAEYGATKTPPTTELYENYYDGHYPRLKNVTILEDKPSGGTIRVYMNDWSGVYLYVDDYTMISMEAYKDYFDVPIVGIGDNSRFPQPDVRRGYPDPDVEFPGHMIGTGAYKFIEHDEVTGQGTMRRYDNWWNLTVMQANNYSVVPELAIVTFPLSQAGFQGRNTAMVAGEIDFAEDDGTLVYDDMVADPDINYVVSGVSPDRIFITLNGINETYWKTWADTGVNVSAIVGSDMSYLYDIDDVDHTVQVEGINRAMRKALSYAFNYDTYINTIQEGRARRSGGFLSLQNEYYNPNISLAYRNLTIARQALIDDPFWGSRVAARGLDINSPDADWVSKANSDPIFVIKLLWDEDTFDRVSVFGNSIKDIGLVLGGVNGAPDPALKVQPDIYSVLFSEQQVRLFPWFTSHGAPSTWPGTDVKFGPSIEYYCKSPGLPYVNGTEVFPQTTLINNGFHYNATVDFWIDKTWFVNRTEGKELWDNLTRHYQTYQYSDIMISQPMYGFAIDKDWTFPLWGLGFEFVRYFGELIDDDIIPGFQIAAILAIAVVTITGIGFSLNRKRKCAIN